MDKDEDLRFGLLVEAFGDADSSGVALVTDLIVFFNTILSSAYEFEERVMLRTEMISAGIIEAVQRIRDYYGLSKVSPLCFLWVFSPRIIRGLHHSWRNCKNSWVFILLHRRSFCSHLHLLIEWYHARMNQDGKWVR